MRVCFVWLNLVRARARAKARARARVRASAHRRYEERRVDGRRQEGRRGLPGESDCALEQPGVRGAHARGRDAEERCRGGELRWLVGPGLGCHTGLGTTSLSHGFHTVRKTSGTAKD